MTLSQSPHAQSPIAWTPAEIAILVANYPVIGCAASARLLPGRTADSISGKAKRMGLVSGNPRSGRPKVARLDAVKTDVENPESGNTEPERPKPGPPQVVAVAACDSRPLAGSPGDSRASDGRLVLPTRSIPVSRPQDDCRRSGRGDRPSPRKHLERIDPTPDQILRQCAEIRAAKIEYGTPHCQAPPKPNRIQAKEARLGVGVRWNGEWI